MNFILQLTFIFSVLLSPGVSFAADPIACLKRKDALLRACVLIPSQLAHCKKGQLAYEAGSCLIQDQSELISEIVDAPWAADSTLEPKFRSIIEDAKHPELSRIAMPNLSLLAQIPLKILTEENEARIVKSLIYRTYLHNDLPEIEKLIDPKRKTSVQNLMPISHAVKTQIAFRPEIAEKIAKNGFLNYYQVGKTTGTTGIENRLATEAFYWNLRFILSPADFSNPQLKLSVFPKYGYATPVMAMSELSEQQGFFYSYGSIFAELKPAVNLRTTYTPNDSMRYAQQNSEQKIVLHTARMLKNKTSALTATSGRYAEAQVLGSLSVSDVDDLIVNCFSGTTIDHTTIAIMKKDEACRLASLFNTKVYECDIHFRTKDEKSEQAIASLPAQAYSNEGIDRVSKGALLCAP